MEEENTQEPPKNEEIDMSKAYKAKQMQVLESVMKGNMNQNDLAALFTMMQKQEGSGFGDMMPMIMMQKMMQPKQDPMMLMMLMNSMKGGDSGVDKKIEHLEGIIKGKEDKKLYEEVMREIRNIKDTQNQVGIKDILSIVTKKDQAIDQIKQIANDKDRQVMMEQFKTLVSGLKNTQSSGDIGKVKETIGAIKSIYNDLGLEKVGQKSKEEIIGGLVENVAKTVAPAINTYVQKMGTQTQPTPQFAQPVHLTPEQSQRLQEIRAQREGNSTPSVNPPPTPGSPTENNPAEVESFKDDDGNMVYPSLINVAEGRNRPARKPRSA